MKTILSLNKIEMREFLSKIIPPEFFPPGAVVTDFESMGYPEREYKITIETGICVEDNKP